SPRPTAPWSRSWRRPGWSWPARPTPSSSPSAEWASTTTRARRTTRGIATLTPRAAPPAGPRWRWRRARGRWPSAATPAAAGGSVRIPAALCGIVGLKTTVGRISRAGVYPLSWSLDSVGPLTRTVRDAALVYQVLQGVDFADETTVGVAPHDALQGLEDGVRGLRIAFGETLFFDDVDAEVETAVREAGKVLQSLGAHVGSVAVPEVAEAWAEKARPLMVAAESCAVNADFLDRHFAELDPAVAHRMIAGRTLPAADYFALLRRYAALRAGVHHTLRDVAALIVPTTMIPARPLSAVA